MHIKKKSSRHLITRQFTQRILGLTAVLLEIVYLKFCHYLHTLMSFETMIFHCDVFLLWNTKRDFFWENIYAAVLHTYKLLRYIAFIYFLYLFIWTVIVWKRASKNHIVCSNEKITYRCVNNDQDFIIQWTIPSRTLWGPNFSSHEKNIYYVPQFRKCGDIFLIWIKRKLKDFPIMSQYFIHNRT